MVSTKKKEGGILCQDHLVIINKAKAPLGGVFASRKWWDYFTAFFSSEPTLNLTALRAGIWMVAPVCGLRPALALRLVTVKVPKPVTVTSSPRFKEAVIVSSKPFNMRPASALLRPDLAKNSTRSYIVMIVIQ